MKHFTRHKLSGARAERSIFGTIFKAMVGVLLVEVALLVASIYAMRVGPQLPYDILYQTAHSVLPTSY